MNILVLDDDRVIRDSIKSALSESHAVHLAANFDEAVDLLEEAELDAAIVDLDLKDKLHDGIEFLELFKSRYPGNPVIVESGRKDIPTVVNCIKKGADDYIEKPFDADTLKLKIDKVLSDSKKRRTLERALEKTSRANQIVGIHPSLLKAKEAVEKAGNLRILFYGETGVGKTPFAWLSNQIVSHMENQVRPFEQLNCAYLNKEYFKDEMFGHKKGAFTSAIGDKRGLVELAKGGDLFLDEVGEMPLDVQALFLTFLDNMEYSRLGDDQKRKANVRILCATNRDLHKMVKEGTFRKDLLSRIAQVEIHIPPLRERLSDLPLLFEHFVTESAGFAKPYDPEILRSFEKFTWEEGNVRELRDAVSYLCISSRDSEKIELRHLSDDYRPIEAAELAGADSSALESNVVQNVFRYGLDCYLGHIEKKILLAVLKEKKESLENLARRLQTSKPTLYRRMKKHDIPVGE